VHAGPDHQGRPEQLAACGLSKRKTEYILDLADHFKNKRVHTAQWDQMDDEAVIAELTQIRGIGRWTAEMFLIFNLLRPNVLPLDDPGLIQGISQNYFSGEPVSRSDAREFPPTGNPGARWPPGIYGVVWTRCCRIDTLIAARGLFAPTP
jgi:DNA-3-methyladenine glycosylase II